MKATIKLEDGREVELVLTDEQEKAIEPKKYGRQRAKYGKDYYFIDDYGGVNSICEGFEKTDNFRFSLGNYYLTKEEAEKALRIQINIVKINDRIDELNEGWIPDWSDSNQSKHSIIFYNTIDVDIFYTYSHMSKINALKSEEASKNIISEFKEELEEIFANQK